MLKGLLVLINLKYIELLNRLEDADWLMSYGEWNSSLYLMQVEMINRGTSQIAK